MSCCQCSECRDAAVDPLFNLGKRLILTHIEDLKSQIQKLEECVSTLTESRAIETARAIAAENELGVFRTMANAELKSLRERMKSE